MAWVLMHLYFELPTFHKSRNTSSRCSVTWRTHSNETEDAKKKLCGGSITDETAFLRTRLCIPRCRSKEIKGPINLIDVRRKNPVFAERIL